MCLVEKESMTTLGLGIILGSIFLHSFCFGCIVHCQSRMLMNYDGYMYLQHVQRFVFLRTPAIYKPIIFVYSRIPLR